MAQVLANSIKVTEQFVVLDGLPVPWYLLPFTHKGIERDPFVEHRLAWARLMVKNFWDPTSDKPIPRDENFYYLVKSNPAFAGHYVAHIRTKDAFGTNMARFERWTMLQRKLYWAFSAAWFYDIPVRIIVLKARQQGASTWAEWMMFWCVVLSEYAENRYGIIMADKDANSSRIFSMAERFYINLDKALDPQYIPDRQTHSGWQLLLGELRRAHMTTHGKRSGEPDKPQGPVLNSGIEVTTAGARQKERGLTASDFHASELAFWPDPEEAWTAIAQGIPYVPRSLVVLESTANIWSQLRRGEGAARLSLEYR